MKAFAAAHKDCTGLQLLPLALKGAWQTTALTLWG